VSFQRAPFVFGTPCKLWAYLFPGSSHITQVGLAGETADATIWEYARQNGFAIVTADADFLRLADQHGAPPKVVRLERMDYSTEVAAELIRRYAIECYRARLRGRIVRSRYENRFSGPSVSLRHGVRGIERVRLHHARS
jgi:predicted nuclease of predicted toxin-antitoxin system